MAKLSKPSVHYRKATPPPLRVFGAPLRRCGTCSMFRVPASCTLVAGKIGKLDVCDRWAK